MRSIGGTFDVRFNDTRPSRVMLVYICDFRFSIKFSKEKLKTSQEFIFNKEVSCATRITHNSKFMSKHFASLSFH